MVLNQGEIQLYTRYSVLVSKEKESNKWEYSLLKYVVEDSRLLQSVTFFDKGSFDGSLYTMNTDGGILNITVFEKGKQMAIIQDVKKGVISSTSKEPDVACRGPICNGDAPGGSGRMMYVTTTTYTDYYNVRSDGSYDYNGSVVTGSKTEYVWVSNSEGYGNGNFVQQHRHATGGRGPSSSNAHPVEIIFDATFKNTKADCAYKKLAEKNGNLFKKTIGKFIKDPEYKLTFKVGNCTKTDDACTNANNVNDMSIIIEDTKQSGLKLAASLLHEGIHAEIYRYVNRRKAGVDPNDRPRLFQLYAYYKGWADKINDQEYKWRYDAQHQYMVENYVKPIAEAVRELDGNKYPISHYLAYGWDGLTASGYLSKKLTKAEDSVNQNLRSQVESKFNEFCK